MIQPTTHCEGGGNGEKLESMHDSSISLRLKNRTCSNLNKSESH